MTDMSRAGTKTDGGVATMGLQVSMPSLAGARQPRRKVLSLSAEEQRMADNAKRIRGDAADGTLEDLTGLRGKELMSRLLRK